MKGLKKLALVSAIAAISAGAQAELKALDDSTMGQMTGQAGLTIDIETKYTIGEFVYQDAGMLVISDIAFGGSSNPVTGGTMFDNVRLNIDIAGPAESLNYGLSELQEMAATLVSLGNTDGTVGAIAAGAVVGGKKTYDDGDLVIHIDATDHLAQGGGYSAFRAGSGHSVGGATTGLDTTVSFPILQTIVHTAADFKLTVGAIGLSASTNTGVIGSIDLGTTANTTTLISGLSIQGYLGPVDISIENDGNGFGVEDLGASNVDLDFDGIADANTGDADSVIHWDSYFDITDLDVYIDIAGVKIENMKINNTRGDTTGLDGKTSFGFAHSMRNIYAVQDAVLNALTGTYVDGIAIDTVFKGDQEIGALSFGNTGVSIGKLYWTDIQSTTNWVISAH